MKKFKTRVKHNYLTILIIIIILVTFIVLSFTKLNKSYVRLVNIVTSGFKDDNKRFILTKKLDCLINSYSFKKTDKIYKEIKKDK